MDHGNFDSRHGLYGVDRITDSGVYESTKISGGYVEKNEESSRGNESPQPSIRKSEKKQSSW